MSHETEQEMDHETQAHFNKSNMIAFTGRLNKKQVTDSINMAKTTLVMHYGKLADEAKERLQSDPSVKEECDNLTRIFSELSGALFEVNVVSKTTGELIGYTYLWTNSPVLFHILCGFDPDGSKRVKQVIDPTWEAPEDLAHIDLTLPNAKQLVDEHIATVLEAATDGLDKDSDEYREAVETVNKTYKYPLAEVDDIPIIRAPPIEYSDEQYEAVKRDSLMFSTPQKILYAKTPEELQAVSEHLKLSPQTIKYASDPLGWIEFTRKQLEESRRNILGSFYEPLPTDWDPAWDTKVPCFNPEGFHPDRLGGVAISRATVKERDVSEDKTILCCRNVPHWVTHKMLYDVFGRYSTDKRERQITEDGVSKRITYPHIRLNPDGTDKREAKIDPWGGKQQMANVTFSNLGDSQWDGLFALQMCRQVVIPRPSTITTGPEEARLVFSLWIRSDYTRPRAAPYVPSGGRGAGREGGRGGQRQDHGGRGWGRGRGGDRREGGRGRSDSWVPKPEKQALPPPRTGVPQPATSTPQIIPGPFVGGNAVASPERSSGPTVNEWFSRPKLTAEHRPPTNTPDRAAPPPLSARQQAFAGVPVSGRPQPKSLPPPRTVPV